MQKKVGIITFHNSVNYGAVMQAYALQKFLLMNGYDVEIIDYVNQKIDDELKISQESSGKSVKNKLKNILKKVYKIKKSNSFRNFNDRNLCLSKERNLNITNISQIKDKYDYIITGSDQVWNVDLTGNDLSYYLNFVSNKIKRIGYAVSIGDNKEMDLSIAISDMKKFTGISVREDFLKEKLEKEYNINSAVCSDPTLLLSEKEYDEISSKRIIKDKYIFCFMMENKKEILDVAKKMAKIHGYKVVDNKNSVDFFLHCAPKDFISWIKNAEYVLTDSFHGTMFSIIYNKQFISDKYSKAMKLKTRALSVLKEVGLDNYFKEISLENYDNIIKEFEKTKDNKKIEKNIQAYSKKSKEWILKMLKDNK